MRHRLGFIFKGGGNSRTSRLGGAMLELVVVLPVLLLLTVGVVEFGRVFYTSVAVANAARAGAEWGAQSFQNAASTAEIQSFALADGAEVGAQVDSVRNVCRCGTTVIACNSGFCGSGEAPRGWVVVGTSKVVPFMMKYPGLPASIKVSRTASFRYQ